MGKRERKPTDVTTRWMVGSPPKVTIPVLTDIGRAGFFRCRLTERSDIEGLGKLIKRFANAGHAPYFYITGADNDSSTITQSVPIDDRVLDRMIRSRGTTSPFVMKEVTIRAASNTTKTAISLCFTRGTDFPISGFPRRLHIDHQDSPGLPSRLGLKSVGSIRWASRSGSQRQRRLDWTPPNLPPPRAQEDIIAQYSDSRHLLGSATSLVSMADAFAAHAPPPTTTNLSGIQGIKRSFSKHARSTTNLSWHSSPRTTIHELPALETTHELPAIEIIHELSADETRGGDGHPTLWMADDDWADTETARAPDSIYMSLTCGDVLQVLEMAGKKDADDSVWRVVRPSDGRKGWVPRRCLRPLERAPPPPPPRSPAGTDASPVGGSYW
jgi:hypothetical protein